MKIWMFSPMVGLLILTAITDWSSADYISKVHSQPINQNGSLQRYDSLIHIRPPPFFD